MRTAGRWHLTGLTPGCLQDLIYSSDRGLTAPSLISIAFYTRGGLGALSAVIVTPSIRTWSRFVVVIALLGLLAVGLALTWLETRRGRVVALLAAGSILVVGVLDQTNPAMAPDYPALRATSGETAAYASSLEGVVGPGCSVFSSRLSRSPSRHRRWR